MLHVFIVNPYARNRVIVDELRERLKKIPDLKFYIFSTRYEGHEKDLIRTVLDVFEGEQIRFYCCGGSGTMRNLLNGFPDLSKVEVAFFPCGEDNSFVKVFGDKARFFGQIENLIFGKKLQVDYIKTNQGVALNTFSIGMDCDILQHLSSYQRIVLGALPYLISCVTAILGSKKEDYKVEIDIGRFHCSTFQILVANGNYLGGALEVWDNPSVIDGHAFYAIAPNCNLFTMLRIIFDMYRGKNDANRRKVRHGQLFRMKVSRVDGEPIGASLDGEYIVSDEWELEIVKQGLSFIVPREVMP